jgi:hypothetical protein
MMNLTELLEPIASQLRSLGIPEPNSALGTSFDDGNCGICDGQFCGFSRMAGTGTDGLSCGD